LTWTKFKILNTLGHDTGDLLLQSGTSPGQLRAAQ
jgi:hypothetical protein